MLAVELFQLLLDAVAFQRGQVVDEQLAVEVVAFVLDTYRQQVFGDQLKGLAVTVQGLDLDFGRSIDVFVEAGYRQTAFLILADAWGVIHCFEHVVDQLTQRVIDHLHRLGDGA